MDGRGNSEDIASAANAVAEVGRGRSGVEDLLLVLWLLRDDVDEGWTQRCLARCGVGGRGRREGDGLGCRGATVQLALESGSVCLGDGSWLVGISSN